MMYMAPNFSNRFFDVNYIFLSLIDLLSFPSAFFTSPIHVLISVIAFSILLLVCISLHHLADIHTFCLHATDIYSFILAFNILHDVLARSFKVRECLVMSWGNQSNVTLHLLGLIITN